MPVPLTVYNNQTPVDINKKDLDKALNLLNQIQHNIQFFAVRLNDHPKMDDIHTHMGLLESYTKELAPLVQYDSVLAEEAERRSKELRTANQTIRELERKLGENITAEGISSKIEEYEDIIRLWYGAHGFDYAKIEERYAYGMRLEFNYDLQYGQDDGCSGRKEWTPFFKKAFGLIANQENPEASPYELWYDTYHAELLDTNKNKELIAKLIQENFPNATLRGFSSIRNDIGSYSMRFSVNIPYTDIEALSERIIPRKGLDDDSK